MTRVREFLAIYRAYRVSGYHSRRYCARIAFGCAFRQLPF
jgi:hypothetical protein